MQTVAIYSVQRILLSKWHIFAYLNIILQISVNVEHGNLEKNSAKLFKTSEFPASVTVFNEEVTTMKTRLRHKTTFSYQMLHHTGAVLAIVRRSRAQCLHHFRRTLRPRVAEIGEVPGLSLRLQSRSRRAHASVKNLPDRAVQNKQKIIHRN